MLSEREGNRVDPRRLPLSQISLGVVCPMANEEPTAVTFVREVLAHCALPGFKSVTLFVILDQKSTDRTRELLGGLQDCGNNLLVIWSPENRCVVDAYLVGYRKALASECDWILEMDAGFSHQPSDLAGFFNKMSQGYDCVFGSRFCPGGSMTESPLARRLISRGGTVISNLLLGTRLQDMTSGFELFTRHALQLVVNKGIRSRGPFFQTEIKAYCRNLHITEVPIQYRAASYKVGSSALKDSFSNLWRLFRLRLQDALCL